MIHSYINFFIKPLGCYKQKSSYFSNLTTCKPIHIKQYFKNSPTSNITCCTDTFNPVTSNIPIEILQNIEKYHDFPNEIQKELMKNYLISLGITDFIDSIYNAILNKQNLLFFFIIVYS